MKPIHIYLNYSMACIKSNFFVDLISKIGDKNNQKGNVNFIL